MNTRQWMASDKHMERNSLEQGRTTRQEIWDMSTFRTRVMQWGAVLAIGAMSLLPGRVARADGLESPASFAYPTVYVSSPDTGNVQGTGYADEDIMRFNSGAGTWSKAFDGTDAGLPDSADIDALAYQPVNLGSSYCMSFDTPVTVPGYYQAELKAKDEDLLVYNGQSGKFILNFIGVQNGLKGKNNITGTASTYSGDADLDFYAVKRQGTFASSQNSVTAAPNDIVVREQSIVMDRYTLFFDASASGFPKVDAFDVVRK